jgi:pyruvate dehydrogenase E2 component (dihydrolipoamide acetyltransferase)
MAEVVEMIQLSPTMEEGILVEWLISEGDTIASGDLLAEVETDKATMEMESYYEGTILKLLVEEGQGASVGTPIAIVGEEGEDISDLLEELKSDASGDADQKADSGDEEEEADQQADEAEASTEEETPEDTTAAAPAASSKTRDGGRIFVSPVARNLAADNDLDLELIDGSGPNGRIVKADVEKAIEEGTAKRTAAPAATRAKAPAEVAATGEGDKDVELSQMRKSIARNLTEAWQAPAFMLTRTVTVDRALDFRKRLNQRLEDRGDPKVSINDIIIKASAMALQDVPEMNASYGGDHIRMYEHADIGFAVALDGGLITPIVRQAENLGLSEISQQTRELAERARDKKLKPEEFTGATFSISNLGMFGIDHFTAVLNPPGAGILAVGTIRKEPVYNDEDELVPAQRMTITLTCDHRAVDGALGAKFLDQLCTYLEDPMMMLG